MPLDLMGNITLTLSVVILFLLVLGLPLVRGINNKKNLTRHGYLTIVALVVQTILVFIVMLPSTFKSPEAILALTPLYSLNSWSHFVLGAVAEVSGLWFILLWLVYSVSNMRCVTAKKYMMPSMIVWIIAIVTGALIHVLQMF
jgi:hypothetical protein